MIRINWWLIRFKLWRLYIRLTLRRLCPRCHGYGCIERLDSGVMLRFRLRPWDGCTACGGTRDTRGTGLAAGRTAIDP